MFLGGPVIGPEGSGSRADAPGAEPDLQAEVGGFGAEILQVLVLEVLEWFEVGDEEGIQFQGGGVVDQLDGIPVHGAHGEIVETEFDGRGGGGIGAGGGTG